MPEYLRPTRLQRLVPHSAWVDMVMFSEARDDIFRHTDLSLFPVLRYKMCTLSVNWPCPVSTITIEIPDRKDPMLNPAFEAHLRKVTTWTVEAEAADVFPFLKPYVKILL